MTGPTRMPRPGLGGLKMLPPAPAQAPPSGTGGFPGGGGGRSNHSLPLLMGAHDDAPAPDAPMGPRPESTGGGRSHSFPLLTGGHDAEDREADAHALVPRSDQDHDRSEDRRQNRGFGTRAGRRAAYLAARPGMKAAHRAFLERKHARHAAQKEFRGRLAAATGNELSTGRSHRGFWRDAAAYGDEQGSHEAAMRGLPQFLHGYFAKRTARRERYRSMLAGRNGRRRPQAPMLAPEQSPMPTQD
jgi:hypothetical protein